MPAADGAETSGITMPLGDISVTVSPARQVTGNNSAISATDDTAHEVPSTEHTSNVTSEAVVAGKTGSAHSEKAPANARTGIIIRFIGMPPLPLNR